MPAALPRARLNAMLNKEDYLEPDCPFDTSMWEQNEEKGMVPMDRITEKEDSLLARNDYPAAERLLLYWIEEARSLADRRGVFLLENELMGLSRKTGQKEKALAHMNAALELVPILGYEDTVSGATCFINAGTVLKAFGMAGDSLPYFERALAVYREKLPKGDPRLAGLYNNMGLALFDLERYDEAMEVYGKALAVNSEIEGTEPESAITRLNMADACAMSLGFEEGEQAIRGHIESAWELLNAPDRKADGNYAFVCEKCAPVFEMYGYTAYAAELARRAEEIYSGGVR